MPGGVHQCAQVAEIRQSYRDVTNHRPHSRRLDVRDTLQVNPVYDTTVGVVGAGAIGIAIAGHLARAGIDATISNGRDPASLFALVRNLGPTLRAGSFDEAVDPEIVFVAVPWLSLPDVLGRVADWEGRIVIDPTNPPTASVGMGVLGGRTSSEIVEEMVPGAHLVKAFNTLPAALLGAKPEAAGGGRRVIFYSGDHVRAKQEVARLIGRIGFAGVDLGTLAAGGRLQQFPGGPLAMLNLLRYPSEQAAT